jgi:UDP-N-acetylmuramoyl-tripeptide--D-alanyl-D-alanine ligase
MQLLGEENIKKISRISKKVKNRSYQPFLYIAAYIWRRLLFRTTFIAITGSIGKTTTKECIAAILSAHYPTSKTLDSRNEQMGVPKTILKIRPGHRFAVVEIGTSRAGTISKSARLVRPDIAIILTVARTHSVSFKNLDDIGTEKAQLLRFVSKNGLVILNAEDERVIKMASVCKNNIKTFGQKMGFDLWADQVSSKWPSTLTFRLNTNYDTLNVKTKLVGEQWVNSVLASFLAAVSCGIDLKTAAVEIEKVKPFIARMQPVTLTSGITIIRDDFNGSADTIPAALQVLREAKVKRRVLVMSNISDLKDKSRDRFKKLGKMAFQSADLAVFISEHGRHAVKTAIASGMKAESVLTFINLEAAASYLKSELRSGDLVLLKGRTSDHVSRVFFAQLGNIRCWKQKCRKMILCDLCNDLKPDFDKNLMLPIELRA